MVSVIGDHYRDKWEPRPWFPSVIQPQVQQPVTYIPSIPEITRVEFEALRKEVLELKELLARAKKYDEETGQRDCEVEDKVALLRRVAEAVGVDLGEVLKPAALSP